MRILVDTNIALDVYLRREPYAIESMKAIQKASKNGNRVYFSCSAITDFYYISKKNLNSSEKAHEFIIHLSKHIRLADVNKKVVFLSLTSNIDDFEDAVVDEVAANINADYILTRNKKDFEYSKVKAITPEEFLSL